MFVCLNACLSVPVCLHVCWPAGVSVYLSVCLPIRVPLHARQKWCPKAVAYALILFAKVSDVNLQAPSPATQTQVQLQQQQLRHWPPYRLQQMELQTPQQAQQAQQPQQAQQQH